MIVPPSSFRLDLKCGKGAISKGEKCHKGPATAVSQYTAQKAAAAVAVVGVATVAGLFAKKAWDAKAARRLADAKKSGFKPATPPPQSTYLSAGNNGKVYISQDRKSIFKITTNRQSLSKFAQELTTQETVRALGVNTPKIKAADPVKGLVEMEFLDGYQPVDQALSSRVPQAQKSSIRNSLLSNMSKLHKAGWGHGDFHYKNVLYKDGNVALIDWGNGAKNMVRIREDIWRTIQLSKDLSVGPERSAVSKAGKQFMDLSNPKQKDVDAFYDQLNMALNYTQRSDALRLDLKCGKGAISKGEKCTKGAATNVAQRSTKKPLAPGLRKGQVYRAMTWGEQFNYTARTKAPDRKGILKSKEVVEGFIRQSAKAYAGWGAVGGALAGTALAGPGAGTALGAGAGAATGAVVGAGLGAAESAISTTFGYGYATPDRIKSRRRGVTTYQSGVVQRDSVYADGFALDLDQLAI